MRVFSVTNQLTGRVVGVFSSIEKAWDYGDEIDPLGKLTSYWEDEVDDPSVCNNLPDEV